MSDTHDSLFRALTEYEQSEGQRALRKLGALNIDVELQLDDVADALELSKLWLTANIGESRQGKLTLVSGIAEYTLPKDVGVVTEVIPPDRLDSTDSVFDIRGPQTRWHYRTFRRGGMFLTTEVQDMINERMQDRVFGRDLSWEFDRRTSKLTIRPASYSGVAWYEYTASMVDLERLEPKALLLFRRYVVAQMMFTLGRIRRKYTEIPMGGSKTGMDGDTLSSDADAEISILDDEVKTLSSHPPFLVG